MVEGCSICGTLDKRIVKHHIDYENDITIPVCDKCHFGLHSGRIKSEFPTLRRPSRKRDVTKGNLKESVITVQVKDNYKVHIPIGTLDAINAKDGDWIDVIVRKGD